MFFHWTYGNFLKFIKSFDGAWNVSFDLSAHVYRKIKKTVLYQIQVMLPRTLSIKIEMKTKASVYIQFHPAQEQRHERESCCSCICACLLQNPSQHSYKYTYKIIYHSICWLWKGKARATELFSELSKLSFIVKVW